MKSIYDKKRVSRNVGQNKEDNEAVGFEPTTASFEGHHINHWATT